MMERIRDGLLIGLSILWLLASISQQAKAQESMIMGPNALAETYCIGGRITSVINMELVGTDSLAEIVAHENVHRAQIARKQPSPAECPPPLTPITLLQDEVEAYCGSRPYRMARGWSKESVDSNYVNRLQNQLRRVLPLRDIESTYRQSCP